jgi:hypothetical protein
MTVTQERPVTAVVLMLADGEAREAKMYPIGDYSCPFCGGAVISPEGWEYSQQLNAEHYAKQGEAYEPRPYPQYMAATYARRGCDNPACLTGMNAEQLAATRQRIADREAGEARRKRDHEYAMERIREAREAEARLWDEVSAKARENGQCVSCLRASYWQSRPKFTRHRDEANCPAKRKWS